MQPSISQASSLWKAAEVGGTILVGDVHACACMCTLCRGGARQIADTHACVSAFFVPLRRHINNGSPFKVSFG